MIPHCRWSRPTLVSLSRPCHGVPGRIVPTMWSAIQAVICDVDGSLCGPLLYYHGAGQGESLKAFHVRDGHRLVWARRSGLPVGLCSGRESAALRERAAELHLEPVLVGVADKLSALRAWATAAKVPMTAIAFVGDDYPDLPLVGAVGLFIAPVDADKAILRRADYITHAAAGAGAVAEVVEKVLISRGAWPPEVE